MNEKFPHEEQHRKKLYSTAIHEAGHVVASHFFGRGSISVSIEIQENGDIHGYNQGNASWTVSVIEGKRRAFLSGYPTRDNIESLWDMGIVFMSGCAASALFGEYGEDWTIDSICDYEREQIECDENGDEIPVSEGSCDAQKAFHLFNKVGRIMLFDEVGKRVRWFSPYRKRLKLSYDYDEIFLEDAINFLKDKTHHVKNIADALLDRFQDGRASLDREEIIKIIGTEPDEMNDIDTAAKILRITKRTLMRRIKAGKVRAVKIGSVWRIPSSFLYSDD